MTRSDRQEETSMPLPKLEDRLRRLPRPGVPEDLAARLIAAIPPAPRSVPGDRSVWLRWVAGAGIAAAAVLALYIAPSWHRMGVADRTMQLRVDAGRVPTVQQASNIEKETDPCNIVPPFADWR